MFCNLLSRFLAGWRKNSVSGECQKWALAPSSVAQINFASKVWLYNLSLYPESKLATDEEVSRLADGSRQVPPPGSGNQVEHSQKSVTMHCAIVQLSVTQMIIGEDSGFITVKSLHNHVKMALINIFAIKWEIYHFKSDLTGSKYQKETVVNFNSSL